MAKKKTKRTRRRAKGPIAVEATTHASEKRLNIPTAEHEPLVTDDDRAPIPVRYPRNTDLDPQLVWRGKDEQDGADLVVPAPPLYIQEKVTPKSLVDDLLRATEARRKTSAPPPPPPPPQQEQHQPLPLFADFNGLPEGVEKTDFYRHRGNWSNRLILGDSLRVMASLTEREELRGKVQCIYLDPPYGIKFNSNFQWSTTNRDVKDGKREHISRDPEQVKAFRDTWRDGIHSYLSYLRDRLTAARELLTESGSIFVQIGDENVHRVRALMDEVFGDKNFVGEIAFNKTTGFSGKFLSQVTDTILWYARSPEHLKYRQLWQDKVPGDDGATKYRPVGTYSTVMGTTDSTRLATSDQLTSQGASSRDEPIDCDGISFPPREGLHWKTTGGGIRRLARAGRIFVEGRTPRFLKLLEDTPVFPKTNVWMDVGGIQSRTDPKVYVVQTSTKAVSRCLLMTTDPGDLVLDPTCGSGTTAYVAEQWGRRWITIDTSRVALALARARIMGARYSYYTLADSAEGQREEARMSGRAPKSERTYGDLRQGFVYKRVSHITLKAIANNTEIDAVWVQRQPAVESALAALNETLSGHPTPFLVTCGARKREAVNFKGRRKAIVTLPNGDSAPAHGLLEWEVPRDPPQDWPEAAKAALEEFWEARLTRQREIDDSISRRADHELLYDQPVEDRSKVRVAGPFTVESVSPHRTLAVDEQDELILRAAEPRAPYGTGEFGDFSTMILEHLRSAGVQQPRKKDRIEFTSLTPWPGLHLAAEGRWAEGERGRERRAGVLIGPEFGTVSRQDLVDAAREAADAGFDAVVSCAFAYDALSADLAKLGRVRLLKARMNADLHMADDLKNTGKGNLFVVFGEPDIEIEPADGGEGADDPALLQVRLRGVDVFHPGTGEIRSDDPKDIACWFLDTDYDGESFFVRHAYFPGAVSDPYKALKTTLKAEIDAEAWQSLRREVSRPFPKPASGRIAVKVINHLGDEVMKAFRV